MHVDPRSASCWPFAEDDTGSSSSPTTARQCMDGGIALNEWLVQRAISSSTKSPTAPSRLEGLKIDWAKTTAWGSGGYYGRLFLNVEGREPQGVIPPDGYEAPATRSSPSWRRWATRPADRDGRAQPEELYAEPCGIAARPVRLLRRPPLAERRHGRDRDDPHVRERHRPRRREPCARGALRARRRRRPAGPGPQRALHDVAPTLLELLGEPVPADMEGADHAPAGGCERLPSLRLPATIPSRTRAPFSR